MKRFTSLTIATLALLTACTNSSTTPATTTTIATTTTSTTSTTIAPTTTLSPTTLAPVTTKAPSTTKPKTTVAPAVDTRPPAEIAASFAASMSKIQANVLETGMKVATQKRDASWAKYKALGAKLSWFDSELSPSRGTYPEWSDNYRFELRGEVFCYTHTATQANNFETVFAPTDC